MAIAVAISARASFFIRGVSFKAEVRGATVRLRMTETA